MGQASRKPLAKRDAVTNGTGWKCQVGPMQYESKTSTKDSPVCLGAP